MPLDPNIILQAQQIQAPDIIGTAVKGMTLKQLMLQNQSQQRAYDDDQTMRDAFAQNTKIGPDGTPTVDRQGVLAHLTKNAPQLAMAKKLEFQGQDKTAADNAADIIAKHGDMLHQLSMSVPVGDQIPMEQKQAAWTKMLDQAEKLGLDNSTLSKAYPGDGYMTQMQHNTMKANDLYERQQKDRELDIRQQELNLKRGERADSQHDKYVTHIEDTAKAWRSDPASLRNDTQIAAAASGKAMIDRYRGHEDDMPMADIHALVSDRLKAISGVAPIEPEIEAQLPPEFRGTVAHPIDALLGKQHGANAGDFVRNIDQGFQDMEKTARKGLMSRQYGVTNSPRLSPDEKARISSIGVPPPVYQNSAQTVLMRDPKGNLRSVAADQVDAAKAAGGTVVGGR